MKKKKKYSRNVKAEEYIEFNLDDLWSAVKELQRLLVVIIIVISAVTVKPVIKLLKKIIDNIN